ncbi:MAG: MFS transporter [Chloroflexi bacterium]|nr:MFS transporter [Chloroflexota bacterium]
MERLEKQVVGYTSVCHGLVHVLELTYGAVLISIAREFGVSLFVLGILANILGFAFGAMSLPTGFLADRKSERNLLILCCLGMGAASIVIGLSSNIYILGIGLLALGSALGIYHPAAATFISRVVAQRSLGFGYQGVGGNIGLALGPILAGIIAAFLDWRAAYLIFAVPAWLLAAVFFFTMRDDKPTVIQLATGESGEVEASWRPVIIPLVLICTAQVMNGFIYRGLVTFLPLYLSQRVSITILNFDPVLVAGSFTTVALIFGVGGQFLGGYLSEHRRPDTIAFVLALLAVPLLLAMGSSYGLTLIMAAAGFAFFHFMTQPTYNSLIANYTPAQWRGRMFGIYFFATYGGGSFSASILGYVADRLGTNWVFILSAGFGLVVILCTLVLFVRALRRP